MLEFLKKTFPYEKDEFNYEYDGYTFEVKNKKLFYRKGKSTPKYSGIFVTL